MDLGLGLFYYTLIVLLAVILTAATCLASYLVTRNKTYRYAFAGFLFYFFDVALVFQDDFLMQRAPTRPPRPSSSAALSLPSSSRRRAHIVLARAVRVPGGG